MLMAVPGKQPVNYLVGPGVHETPVPQERKLHEEARRTLVAISREECICSLELLTIGLALDASIHEGGQVPEDPDGLDEIRGNTRILLDLGQDGTDPSCLDPINSDLVEQAFSCRFGPKDKPDPAWQQLGHEIATITGAAVARNFSESYRTKEETRHLSEQKKHIGWPGRLLHRVGLWLGLTTPYARQVSDSGRPGIDRQAALDCGYGANWITRLMHTYRLFYPREGDEYCRRRDEAVLRANELIAAHEKKHGVRLSPWDKKAVTLRQYHRDMDDRQYRDSLIEFLNIQQQSRKNWLKAEICVGTVLAGVTLLVSGPIGIGIGLGLGCALYAMSYFKMQKDSSIAQHALSFFSDHGKRLGQPGIEEAVQHRRGGGLKLLTTINAFASAAASAMKSSLSVIEKVLRPVPLLGLTLTLTNLVTKGGTALRRKANHWRLADGAQDFARLLTIGTSASHGRPTPEKVSQTVDLYRLLFTRG